MHPNCFGSDSALSKLPALATSEGRANRPMTGDSLVSLGRVGALSGAAVASPGSLEACRKRGLAEMMPVQNISVISLGSILIQSW